MSPGYAFNIRSKGHRSKSQGHKVQKQISVEEDRVADVSLYSIEWPASSYILLFTAMKVTTMVKG